MVGRIIETPDCVAEGADWLARAEPRFAHALQQTGPLPLRRRKDGFDQVLSAIVSQQVSVAAANAIWGRLRAAGLTGPRKILWASDEDLRACGLSLRAIAAELGKRGFKSRKARPFAAMQISRMLAA